MRILTLCTSAVLLLSSSVLAGDDTPPPPNHVQLAWRYVGIIDPVNNHYASPLDVWFSNGELHAETKCGSYAAHLYKAAYHTVDETVFTGLFNSTSPNAAKWYDGLAGNNVFVNEWGQFGTYVVPTVDLIQPGDVLAGKYNSGSASGHVMVTASVGEPEKINLPGKIPGYTIVTEREIDVHDSTRFPHGKVDSRDEAENGEDDEGLGWGRIVLYSDPVSDVIIGWKWSTWTSKVYQMTDPDADDYRPLVAGGLTGPGLPGF